MAFSAFSFLMVLASYFVPVLPLVLKLRRVKFQELDRIEKRIDLKYDGVGATGAPDQEDLERLLTFRDVVRRIHVLPPNGQVSFLTAVSAIVVAFLPSVIQYWTNLPQ